MRHMARQPTLDAREMRRLPRLAVIEELIGEDLAAAVEEEPDERIGPHEPGVAPADRRNEPAIDRGECADKLRRLGRGKQFPAGPRTLPDRSLVASEVDGQMAGDQELQEDQGLQLG